MAGAGGWTYTGAKRPPFAEAPGPGQESVWDYPRPPRVERDRRRVEVYAGRVRLADTRRALRVLETASPPTFYVPRADVDTRLLAPERGATFCEWKGTATYHAVVIADRRIPHAAWSYPEPRPGFEKLAGAIAFYPARLDCRVGGERVEPQPGGFYGGWVTPELVGPFKGSPGSGWW